MNNVIQLFCAHLQQIQPHGNKKVKGQPMFKGRILCHIYFIEFIWLYYRNNI